MLKRICDAPEPDSNPKTIKEFSDSLFGLNGISKKIEFDMDRIRKGQVTQNELEDLRNYYTDSQEKIKTFKN